MGEKGGPEWSQVVQNDNKCQRKKRQRDIVSEEGHDAEETSQDNYPFIVDRQVFAGVLLGDGEAEGHGEKHEGGAENLEVTHGQVILLSDLETYSGSCECQREDINHDYG